MLTVLKEQLAIYGYHDDNVELHFHIWHSMDGPFNQQATDAPIDLLSSEAK
jgi:hypothetical protein